MVSTVRRLFQDKTVALTGLTRSEAVSRLEICSGSGRLRVLSQ